MLTPEYLDSCSDSILGIYDALNTQIVQDIARRIAKTGSVTDSAKWQIKQVQEAGKLLEEITHEVASITGFSDDYVKSLFDEAGVKSLEYESKFVTAAGLSEITLDKSPAMMQVLAAAIEKTQGNLNNLTGTTATAAQSLYLEATNMAYMQVSSGAFSYQEAIKQAVRSAAIQGSKVYYSNGHSSKLDVAIRRSLLTGVNQTAANLTEMYAEDMDCDYYETSAHAGARNTGSGYLNHESWQGQVFCISGKDKKYRQFEEATGYGTGDGIAVIASTCFFPDFPSLPTVIPYWQDMQTGLMCIRPLMAVRKFLANTTAHRGREPMKDPYVNQKPFLLAITQQ